METIRRMAATRAKLFAALVAAGSAAPLVAQPPDPGISVEAPRASAIAAVPAQRLAGRGGVGRLPHRRGHNGAGPITENAPGRPTARRFVQFPGRKCGDNSCPGDRPAAKSRSMAARGDHRVSILFRALDRRGCSRLAVAWIWRSRPD